ncbi:MAG: hypothetical protein ABEK02_09670 [Haloquadratum sp.]
MVGFPSPFGGDASDEEALFDDFDAFVPEHIPEPGDFLTTGAVLTGDAHVAFHRLTREVFEARTVYDMTFGYNLARLNLDTRHPDAGYRYAVVDGAADGSPAALDADATVLRAEFTPTTPFCPQSHTLTVGSFRAWNGLPERHEYDLVDVRVDPMHQEADAINRELRGLAATFCETGDVPDAEAGPTGPDAGAEPATGSGEAGYGPTDPF